MAFCSPLTEQILVCFLCSLTPAARSWKYNHRGCVGSVTRLPRACPRFRTTRACAGSRSVSARVTPQPRPRVERGSRRSAALCLPRGPGTAPAAGGLAPGGVRCSSGSPSPLPPASPAQQALRRPACSRHGFPPHPPRQLWAVPPRSAPTGARGP